MMAIIQRGTLFLAALAMFSAAGRAQTGTITHIEQNDARITYTGVWYPNTESPNSGGAAILANLKGSQAIVTFNGTGITWIGTTDAYCGYAYIYLDGKYTFVDTGSVTGKTLYQQPLFSVRGLTPGVHTLTIEVIHSHSAVTNQSWVWVDGFDIENGTIIGGGVSAGAGLSEESNAAVTYGGRWYNTSGTQYSGGSVVSAVDAGAWINLSFNGTGVDWIGYRDEYSGIAQVYIDGALQATVDTFLSPAKAQAATYSVRGLAAGVHTLKILATATQNVSSGGAFIWVDAFNVTGSTGGPAISAGGVVSAASLAPAPNNQVAPGQIVSIFGTNFLPNGRADAGAMPLPTQLGSSNVTVAACGRNIPLYNVSPTQINAQLPTECPATGTTQLTVTAGGQTSSSQTVNLAPGSAGVFTVNASGSGDGVIFHGNNLLVSSANPAKGGEQVVIYCTGLGPTTPSFASGAAVTGTNQTINPVTVAIGGKNATVVYSGLTAGFAGLYQINVIIPAGMSGSQPVVVTVGSGNTSRAGVNVSVTQ